MKEQREALKGTGVAILEEGPERSTAERSEAGRSEGPSSKIAATSSGGTSPGGSSSVPSPEVADKPRRRGFTVEYKLSVLKKADACTKPGELGTLLRREGLYSSTLSGWRRQRRQGTLAALRAKKRGRKADPVNPLAPRVAELEHEIRRLKQKLHHAETIIDVQKKLSEMLGVPMTPLENESDER